MQDVLRQILVHENMQADSCISLKKSSNTDIFKLTTTSAKFILKINHANALPKAAFCEAEGLRLLQKRSDFIIPNVRSVGEVDGFEYLMISYLPTQGETPAAWDKFGRYLADLHRNSNTYFGLAYQNYIGGLRQSNLFRDTAAAFYIEQRLMPQFELALKKGYTFSALDQFYKNIIDLVPDEPSALIHGDLWNGNFLFTSDGSPALIDPAVAYGNRESDLAMMRLFGGFPQRAFDVYQSYFALETGWKSRIELFQLYYILVHLNLFGASYYIQAKEIIDRYR